MLPDDSQALRTELAALFLFCLVAGGAAILLGWGRLGAPRTGVAPEKPAERPSAFLPARGGEWSVRLSDGEARCLMGLFLDAMEALRAGEPLPKPGPCTEPIDAPLVVTVYRPPDPLLRAKAREADPARSVLEAARLLFGQAGTSVDPERARVRIDVLRAARAWPAARRRVSAEKGFGEPFGAAVRTEEGTALFLPADVVGWEAADNREVLDAACRRAGLKAQSWQSSALPMWRLESIGYVNDAPGSRRVLPSPRGMVPVREVDAASLLRACGLAGRYLARGQRRDGSLLMYSDPSTGLRGGCESLILHAGATAALGALCELRPLEESVRTCRKASAFAMQFTDPDPRRPRMAFTSRRETCHGAEEMEESAQVLEGICRLRRATGRKEIDPWIQMLADFLLFMQDERGRFRLDYDPETGQPEVLPEGDERVVVQARGAVALTLAYRELGTARYLPAARRALAVLMDDEGPGAGAAGESGYSAEQARWLMTALLELTTFLPDERLLQWGARIAAERRSAHLAAADVPADDLAGGTLDGFPPNTRMTADDLVVFAAAAIMNPGGDSMAAAEEAARYVMRLQFLPENSYYLSRPEESVGGFRERPGKNLVKVQTMDSALRGLVLLARLKLQVQDDDREGAH